MSKFEKSKYSDILSGIYHWVWKSFGRGGGLETLAVFFYVKYYLPKVLSNFSDIFLWYQIRLTSLVINVLFSKPNTRLEYILLGSSRYYWSINFKQLSTYGRTSWCFVLIQSKNIFIKSVLETSLDHQMVRNDSGFGSYLPSKVKKYEFFGSFSAL